MAERRMFAKTIIDSDAFLDMPLSAQALYFHLSMRADDEGFMNNPKKIQRMIGASEDDMKILLAKNFILEFESGVIVIKHWKIHNYIRGDRLTQTAYQEEKALLTVKENGAYTLCADLKEIEQLDSTDARKIAYKESSLPYSFNYKIKRVFEGKECPVCGKKMNSAYKLSMPTIQHNVPISKGGKHELDNISVICESCNTSIRDDETGDLNNAEVIEMWDKIVEADKQNIKWFWDVSLLDSHLSDKCQSDVSIGKDSIGKVRLGKDKEKATYYPNDEKLNQAFADYVAMRKQIKSPMTDRAVELAISKLEKLSGGDNDKAIAILEQSVMNSWKGLFELKEIHDKPQQSLAEKWGLT